MGGRYNRVNDNTFYLCLSPQCSAAELLQYWKSNYDPFPRYFYTYTVTLAPDRLLDLSTFKLRSGFGIPERAATGTRGENTYFVADLAHSDDTGYQAFRIPSATGVGLTLVVFPNRVLMGEDIVAHEKFDIWRGWEDVERVRNS